MRFKLVALLRCHPTWFLRPAEHLCSHLISPCTKKTEASHVKSLQKCLVNQQPCGDSRYQKNLTIAPSLLAYQASAHAGNNSGMHQLVHTLAYFQDKFIVEGSWDGTGERTFPQLSSTSASGRLLHNQSRRRRLAAHGRKH